MPKATKLTLHNLGIIEDMVIELNKPLLLFIGDIKVGKSTILLGVKLLRGGAFPPDIIRHGCNEAFVFIEFPGGSIRREWYRDPKSGKNEAREIVFLRDNNPKPVRKPVEEIRKLLSNPFLENQDYLKDMGPTDRCRFFVDFLGIDTGDLDAEKKDLADQVFALQAKIDGYGDIDVTPVEQPNVIAMKNELTLTRKAHTSKVAGWNKELEELRERYQSGPRQELKECDEQIEANWKAADVVKSDIARIEAELERAKTKAGEVERERVRLAENRKRLNILVAELPDLKPQADELKKKIETPLDTSALESKISEASAQEVRYQEYLKRLAKVEERNQANTLLEYAQSRIREIRDLKARKLAEIAEVSGIDGLGFDEDGNFTYDNTTAGLLSTSQLMELSSKISAMYPEQTGGDSGVGLELLDRGESLGEAIFSYIDRAREHDLTILATIVGARPASVPPDVGVFVVSGGKLVDETVAKP